MKKLLAAEINKFLCHGCAKCCMHINHEIDPPESNEDCDYIIWFLLHENISIWVDDENVWYIEFKTPCKELINNRCGIYERRPQVCREYEQHNCLNSNLGEDISFNHPDQFLEYLKTNRIYDYTGYYLAQSSGSSRHWNIIWITLIGLMGISLIIWIIN